MRSRAPAWLAGIACTAALLAGSPLQAAPLARPGQLVKLPELVTIGGALLPKAALKGRVVVFAWFASYCPFCMQEAPKLQKLYAENSGRLLVVGINAEQGDPMQAEKVRQWIGKYGWSFPVTLDTAAVERVLGKPRGIPSLVVIDGAGMVRQVETGEMLDEDFDDIAGWARRQTP